MHFANQIFGGGKKGGQRLEKKRMTQLTGNLSLRWFNSKDPQEAKNLKKKEKSLNRKSHLSSSDTRKEDLEIPKLYFKGIVSFSNQINDSITKKVDPNIVKGYGLIHTAPTAKKTFGDDNQSGYGTIRQKDEVVAEGPEFQNDIQVASKDIGDSMNIFQGDSGLSKETKTRLAEMMVSKRVKEILNECHVEAPAHLDFLRMGQGHNMSTPNLTNKETYQMIMPKKNRQSRRPMQLSDLDF